MKKVLILGVNGFIGHHLSKRILETTDWEVYGMDMQSDRIADLLDRSALPLLRRRHHDQQGMDRVPRQEVRRGPAAGGDRHAATYVKRAAARVRARLRGEPADRALGRASTASAWCSRRPPRSTACAPTREFDPENSELVLRPDQQAALDLRLRQAADGPRDLRLRHGEGLELHAVPSVQLDRRRASTRSTPPKEGSLARDHAVPRPHRARRDRSSWSTAARRSARSPTSTTASTR